MKRFLALSGSLREASTNTALLEAFAANAPDGVSIDVFRGIGTLPIFNPDDEMNLPCAVSDMLEAVRNSDGVIVSCPEYAHGIPGGLKNALDWMVSHDVVVGKPAMLVHASIRSTFSREHLSEVMRTMSFALFDGNAFEIRLTGMDLDQVAAALGDEDTCRHMAGALADFAEFAGNNGV
jgi:chromate reductase